MIEEKQSQSVKSARIAFGVLICGAAAIGFAPIFVRLSEVGPAATAFWRITLALPAFWIWQSLGRQTSPADAKPRTAKDYRGLFLAGLFFACDLAVWHWSLRLTTVANATLFANFAPIFVTLGAWLIFRRRVTSLFVLGMIIALIGATTLMSASLSLSRRFLLGDALGVLTAVFYASYILSVKELRARFPTPVLMFWAGVASAAALLVITLVSRESFFDSSGKGWLVLLALALLSHVGGQGLIAFALRYLPASFSSVTLLLQPVLAAVFAWIILAEYLGPLQILGGIVVLAGILLSRLATRFY